MDIYSRINNHKMINNEDIVNIVDYRLKILNLYKNKKNVIFSNDEDLYFQYLEVINKINVSNNYRNLTLEPILEDELIKPVKKINKSTFFTDFYNLELLMCPYHEVRHAEQYKKIINNKKEYDILLNKSWYYIEYSRKFYNSNHPRFLIEHDANLNAIMLILKDIENGKLKLCSKSLYLFNAYAAEYLLNSRGFYINNNELKKESKFTSPLHMLYLCTNLLYLNKKIDKKELIYVNNCISKLRKQNKTEYDKIISGDNLSDKTINELFLIATCQIKTKNIFKYFEEKELDKNNNHYVKKLLLS